MLGADFLQKSLTLFYPFVTFHTDSKNDYPQRTPDKISVESLLWELYRVLRT